MDANEKRVIYVLIGLVLIVMLFFAIIGARKYLAAQPDEYNGFTVRAIQSGKIVTYETEVFINGQGPYIISTRFAPDQVDDIHIDPAVRSYILNRKLVSLAIDASDDRLRSGTTLGAVEFNNIIEKLYGITISSASTTKTEKFELMTCNMATKDHGLVIYELADKNQVITDGPCLRLQALSDADFVRVSDRLVFELVGVIPNG